MGTLEQFSEAELEAELRRRDHHSSERVTFKYESGTLCENEAVRLFRCNQVPEIVQEAHSKKHSRAGWQPARIIFYVDRDRAEFTFPTFGKAMERLEAMRASEGKGCVVSFGLKKEVERAD